MATTLIVEDGNGVVDANAYVDVSYVDNFVERFADPIVWDVSADSKRRAILSATRFVDLKYGRRYLSTIMTSEQGLLFPRMEFVDGAGRTVMTGDIPKQLKDAVAKLAYLHVNNGSLDFVPQTDNNLKRRSVNVGQGAVQETVEFFEKGDNNPYIESELLLRDLLSDIKNVFIRQAWRG